MHENSRFCDRGMAAPDAASAAGYGLMMSVSRDDALMQPGLQVDCHACYGGSPRRWISVVLSLAVLLGVSGCGGHVRTPPVAAHSRSGISGEGRVIIGRSARLTLFESGYPRAVTDGLASLTAGHRSATVASVPFAPVAPMVTFECQATADAIGYAVPCPTVLPLGTRVTSPVPGDVCGRFGFVAGGVVENELNPRCSSHDPRVRRWFFGTSIVNPSGLDGASFQHLVIQGAPGVIVDPARAIDLPARYVVPQAVLPRGESVIDGIVRRFYVVPLGNPSAMRGHLAVVWTQAGHTYAYSFHVVDGVSVARALDTYLLMHLRLIEPA
jgi:hypothetical protein